MFSWAAWPGYSPLWPWLQWRWLNLKKWRWLSLYKMKMAQFLKNEDCSIFKKIKMVQSLRKNEDGSIFKKIKMAQSVKKWRWVNLCLQQVGHDKKTRGGPPRALKLKHFCISTSLTQTEVCPSTDSTLSVVKSKKKVKVFISPWVPANKLIHPNQE